MSDLSDLFSRVIVSFVGQFSSVGHVFPGKIKNNMERQQVTDLKLSHVHCVQLFSEVEIVYTHAY